MREDDDERVMNAVPQRQACSTSRRGEKSVVILIDRTQRVEHSGHSNRADEAESSATSTEGIAAAEEHRESIQRSKTKPGAMGP